MSIVKVFETQIPLVSEARSDNEKDQKPKTIRKKKSHPTRVVNRKVPADGYNIA